MSLKTKQLCLRLCTGLIISQVLGDTLGSCTQFGQQHMPCHLYSRVIHRHVR
jgi:hypothetical protein